MTPPRGPAPGSGEALIVFAKRPEAGAVKTRLTPLLTPGEAAELYEAFLRDSLDAYARLGADVRLYLTGAGTLPGAWVPGTVSVHEQAGDGLGARMLRALVETFVAGYERALVIGTDHPTLPLAFVERGFEELRLPLSVVLGPSDDGGYYLIGMNEVYPALFDGMRYSHDGVFAQTLARAEATGAAVSVLPPWYDVDTPAALRRLASDVTASDGAASDGAAEAAAAPRRTREVLAGLCRKYAELV